VGAIDDKTRVRPRLGPRGIRSHGEISIHPHIHGACGSGGLRQLRVGEVLQPELEFDGGELLVGETSHGRGFRITELLGPIMPVCGPLGGEVLAQREEETGTAKCGARSALEFLEIAPVR